MDSEIVVSICCITYNHEQYIVDALESFLMQKANFKYEILIHDDASTDKTPEIIREYERRYPKIIKPIYQTENQHSKGVKVGKLNTERAYGKYIALCEGDDYWTNENKLQLQFDYMESHPECSLCVHSSLKVNPIKEKINSIEPFKHHTILQTIDIIKHRNDFATGSMFYRKELIEDYPDFCLATYVGDIPLKLYLSTKGYIYYMNLQMSAYRTNVPGSWTDRMHKSNTKKAEHLSNIIIFYRRFNEYTKYTYNDILIELILFLEFNRELIKGNFKALKHKKYKDVYMKLSSKQKILVLMQVRMPKLYKLLISTKKS